MAILEDHGAQSDDPGRFHRWMEDPDRKVMVYLKIRPLTREKHQEILRRYGVFRKNRATGTKEWQIVDEGRRAESNIEGACWMWTDSKDFYVRASVAEAVEFFRSHLGPEAVNGLAPGQEVCLDGRLTDEIKRYLLRKYWPLSAFIGQYALALQREDEEEEEALTENLPPGSNSGSSSQT